MRELLSIGDPIPLPAGSHGERYGMVGGRELTLDEVNAHAEALAQSARTCISGDVLAWLPDAVIRFHLGEMEYRGELDYAHAAMILARAHITWRQICHLHS